jgi:hypothetical protein
MLKHLHILLICAALMPAAALAQARQIPVGATRGTIASIEGSIIVVDGVQMRLSGGAQFRSENNLIVVPSSVAPDSVVKYILDAQGQIHRVWILTPEEIATPDPQRQAQ